MANVYALFGKESNEKFRATKPVLLRRTAKKSLFFGYDIKVLNAH